MRKDLPSASQVMRRLENFKKFIVSRGAELLTNTSEWELVRFKTGKGVSIVYRSKDPSVACAFTGDAQQAWFEFLNPGSKWRAIPPTKRRIHSSVEYRTIRDRDGILCFFCAEPLAEAEGTIEHLIALTHGGPQHVSNKFLAHEKCNAEVGHLSAPQKILIYHSARLKKLLGKLDDQRRFNHSAGDCHLA